MTCFINSFNSISRGVLDDIKYCDYDYPSLKRGISNIYEMIKSIDESKAEWTIDKYSGVKDGDLNLFLCSASSFQNISMLRSIIQDDLDSNELLYINKLCETYRKYAGKLLAIGIVKYIPNTPDRMELSTFEPVIGIKNPVPYDEFKSFIPVNRYGSMTKIGGDAFNKLLAIIKTYNPDLDISQLNLAAENTMKKQSTPSVRTAPSTQRNQSPSTSSSKASHPIVPQRAKPTPVEPPKMSDKECEAMFPIDCKVRHKSLGFGKVKNNQCGRVTIEFDDGQIKTFGVDFCIKNKLLEKSQQE